MAQKFLEVSVSDKKEVQPDFLVYELAVIVRDYDNYDDYNDYDEDGEEVKPPKPEKAPKPDKAVFFQKLQTYLDKEKIAYRTTKGYTCEIDFSSMQECENFVLKLRKSDLQNTHGKVISAQLKDNKAVKIELMRILLEKARQNAALLATATNVKLGEIHAISTDNLDVVSDLLQQISGRNQNFEDTFEKYAKPFPSSILIGMKVQFTAQ